MMKYLTLLLFLLPTIYAYSLFNFNNDKASNNIQSQDNSVNKRATQATAKATPKATTKKNNNDKGYGPNHSLLPPTESTLSTGLFHTCAITYRAGVDQDTCGNKPCGPVKCWGHDERGQSTPPPGVMFQQISAGGFFTCGVKADGRVVCWGDIDHPLQSFQALSSEEQAKVKRARRLQQEEDRKKGVKNNRSRQQSLHGNDYYLQVSSGNKHACAITKDYDVHCWGRNDYGESSPPPEGKFVHLSAGHSFTCGILSNGEAKCWGKDNMGQSSPPSYPESTFEQVSASIGGDHACGVLKQDGDVQCWGNNGRGQSENQNGNFTQVSAGIRTSCAIQVVDETRVEASLNDDSVSTTIHCWGSRANTLLHHFEPGLVITDKHNQISLGQDHACATSVKKDSDQTSLECWWMAGSNFDAHKVPIGISVV